MRQQTPAAGDRDRREKEQGLGQSIMRGPPLEDEPGIGSLTLGGYLQEVCSRFGPAEAACMRDAAGTGMIRWSYEELRSQSLAVASSLAACGIGRGERVGVIMTNRLEFLAAVFGTALAGGVAAILSTFSTSAELEVLLRQSGVSVLLFERRVLKKDFASILTELEPRIADEWPGELQSDRFPFLRHLVAVDDEPGQAAIGGAIESWSGFLARGADVSPTLVEARAAQVMPSDPGVLFFSSGSTGKPKGILSSHRAVCLQLWRWKQWHKTPGDVRVWSANGLFWSGNFAMFVGGALSGGGTMVLQSTFDAGEAIALLEAERVALPLAWPHQWALLMEAPGWCAAYLSAMRFTTAQRPLAGQPTIQTTWYEPRGYGSTEGFTLVTAHAASRPEEVIPNSNGLPTPGTIIRIIDPLTGEVVPMGERGEIVFKGPTLMLGYVGIPLDESVDDDGFFRTGDGGYFGEGGLLFWEGRLNDIIKTGGANVSPIEIDTVLAGCPGVKAAQTVGVPDELLGELVVSCIVPHQDAAIDEAAVQRFARQTLASYKVPRRVLFVEAGDLGQTGSAKIKTADLRAMAAARLAADPTH
jgi:fatty-acyl-CoA synthase